MAFSFVLVLHPPPSLGALVYVCRYERRQNGKQASSDPIIFRYPHFTLNTQDKEASQRLGAVIGWVSERARNEDDNDYNNDDNVDDVITSIERANERTVPNRKIKSLE